MNVFERIRVAGKAGKGLRLNASDVYAVYRTLDTLYQEPKPYVPAIGVRAPWLAEDNTIDVDKLLRLAREYSSDFVTGRLARDQIRDVKERWAVATAPDAFNPEGKDPTAYFANYAGRTSLADIKRIVDWQG